MRTTLTQMLPGIYTRFAEVPHRIVNETNAVKAALAGNSSNSDLQALNVYRADGTLNEAHPLVSTLRSRLPVDDQFQQFVAADTLRSDIERPPFGWDPNAVRVGLALLLRASACRLIDNSRTLTDPGDPLRCRLFMVGTRFCASAARPNAEHTARERQRLPLPLTAFQCALTKKSTLESPGDPDVLLALTKEQRFKQVRV